MKRCLLFEAVKKNWDFQEILSSKEKVYTDYFVAFGVKRPGFKIGITIPKRFASSVTRNLNRRQIKEIIFKNKILFIDRWVVLIARKTFLDLKFVEKEGEVLRIFALFRKRYGRREREGQRV